MATEAQRRANQRYYEKKRQEEISELLKKLGKVKICSVCGFEGDISLFRPGAPINFEKPTKTQLRGTCKKCRRKSINESNSSPERKKERAKKMWAWICADPVRLQKKKEKNIIYHSQQRVKKMRNEKEKERIKRNPHIRRWRKLLTHTMNRMGLPKNDSTENLLGYSPFDLKNHLGSKPSEDAHIDHLIPVSWFIETTPVSLVCDLRNLEWKTKLQNISKTNRFSDPVCKEYYDLCLEYIKPEYQKRVFFV